MPVPDEELDRQYRVLKQTISMHTMRRDYYKTMALLLDILFLICAVIFCATTFARNDIFESLGFSVQDVRLALGIASIIAFLVSLFALRVGWKGKSALHKEAVMKLNPVLALFRKSRLEDKSWPNSSRSDLDIAYWNAMNNIIEIPSKTFVRLKSKHLRKVKTSKMLDSYPGCPIFILRLIVSFHAVRNALRRNDKDSDDTK